ncbi:choice-of-anchor tandem repeat NxxGxxAF-containing protein [Roseateles amylovorans]|uniref:Uncharacterized protein n=1 Tax=Roseateles amylovorans TaxID=2978473 RepID=A0ABY6B6Z1_9BURK|nr:choice-of-anchor tandem repeat NxxGxxAF-containing protein [Roseateles amylovorans]UXH80704.1 hypothetical protein N4261_12840 [Roseateles amylovorans]
MDLESRNWTWTVLATNADHFSDFSPYVPSINDEGRVAFQAALEAGGTGVFVSNGRDVMAVALSTDPGSPVERFASHPDLDARASLSIYATLQGGEAALVLIDAERGLQAIRPLAPAESIGPLGPTMNDRQEVAVRAVGRSGQAFTQIWRRDTWETIAAAGGSIAGFEGLPVINQRGAIVYRANLTDGQQGLFLQHDGEPRRIAATGPAFSELGRFPILNDLGQVAFAARQASGGWGIYLQDHDERHCLVNAGSQFESLRGVLINNAGLVAFYGTPVGGQLGIYAGSDEPQRLLGRGDSLFGATVTDFALNPVSVNEHGQLAVRVALNDGRQFILRGDRAD